MTQTSLILITLYSLYSLMLDSLTDNEIVENQANYNINEILILLKGLNSNKKTKYNNT